LIKACKESVHAIALPPQSPSSRNSGKLELYSNEVQSNVSLDFEWNEEKAEINEAKHGVSFLEAKTVFNDPFSITVPDPDHSITEDRWVDIGISSRFRILYVVYTERRTAIRIISCRPATPKERRNYEQQQRA
jgi:uncharacterized protein